MCVNISVRRNPLPWGLSSIDWLGSGDFASHTCIHCHTSTHPHVYVHVVYRCDKLGDALSEALSTDAAGTAAALQQGLAEATEMLPSSLELVFRYAPERVK
jgi:hypothetical protein